MAATYNFPDITKGDKKTLPYMTFSGVEIAGCRSQLRDKFGYLVHDFAPVVSGNNIHYGEFQADYAPAVYNYDLEITTNEGEILTVISGNMTILKEFTY